jgi:dTDP-4-amino-4,6-dideoxygalactose transaminase
MPISFPANTFIASIAAIIQAGYTPRLVDCDPEYWLIDTNEVLKKINHKTVGILPVHLYGQMAPMKILRDIAKTHHLALIEDGAQSQGALQDGSPVGTYSTAAATSFYPGKNLGAYGDAGAITTSNEEIATTLRQLRDHGSLVKYQHEILGTNSRLDNIQACILETKLEHLNTWNQMRRKAADYYTQLLKNVPQVQPPKVYPHNTPVWHLYVIAVNKRDHVLKLLQEKNIGAGIHYPIPTHLQNALKFLEYHPGDFPHTESIAKKIISLPLYPGITSQEQEYIIDTLRIITNE